jgi:uncharacterized membrane protein
MRTFTRFLPNSARMLLILLWGGLCCMIFAAPVLAARTKYPTLTAMLYLFFAPICHQIPERSFSLLGRTLTVCHRCAGVYLGLFLGSLLPLGNRLPASPHARRIWVLGAAAPLLLDVALPSFGVWTNGSVSRFTTGLIFGAMLASLFLAGVAELTGRVTEKGQRFQASDIKGGIS